MNAIRAALRAARADARSPAGFAAGVAAGGVAPAAGAAGAVGALLQAPSRKTAAMTPVVKRRVLGCTARLPPL